jgi:hypothetical protein
MPVKKNKTKKNSEEMMDHLDKDVPIDVQYNPEVVSGILIDLKKEVDSKCSQIQRDIDFMSLSLQQAFNLELIKIPTHVKQMSLERFREEFGESLEAVTRGAIGGNSTLKAHNGQHTSGYSSSTKPHHPHKLMQTPSSVNRLALRIPREGEVIQSANGSPLGEFLTAVKAPKEGCSIVPATPGTIILDSGAIIDIDMVETLDEGAKMEAISKV